MVQNLRLQKWMKSCFHIHIQSWHKIPGLAKTKAQIVRHAVIGIERFKHAMAWAAFL